MLLKQIFRYKQIIFRDILDQKVSNHKLYEKAYLRKRYENSKMNHILDNSKTFFPFIKMKKKLSKAMPEEEEQVDQVDEGSPKISYVNGLSFNANGYRIKPKIKVDDLVENLTGSSIYTTNYIYRSRKNASLRFRIPIIKTHKIRNLSNLFLDSLKILTGGRIKEKGSDESSLILLHPERGGFNCYSCGFRGFLSGYQLDCVFHDWHDTFSTLKNTSEFFQLRSFFSLRKIDYMISPPTRFTFEIKTVVEELRFRKKKLVSSRKKRKYNLNKFTPNFFFKSINS
jgi:hypothetical protein